MATRPKNHEIIERYCSHVDDNVVMMRQRQEHDRYVCLSSHRCRHVLPRGCSRAISVDAAEAEDKDGGK